MSGRSAAVRRRLDTPSRLRWAALLVAGWLLVAAVAATGQTVLGGAALANTRDRAGEIVIEAQHVRSEVSNADALAAALAFEHVVLTDPDLDTSEERRSAYLARPGRTSTAGDVEDAAARIVRIQQLGITGCLAGAGAGGSPATPVCAGDLLTRLGELIPRYTGLVETARAHVRTGSATAEAYLRKASELARYEIIPRVDNLIQIAGDEVDADFNAATDGGTDLLLLLLFAGGGTGLLALQVYCFRRSRRVFEARLLAATGCLLAAAGLFGAGVLLRESRAQNSVSEGYVPMVTLSQARVLASQARADENLDMLSLGVDTAYDEGWEGSLAGLDRALTVEELPAEAVARIDSRLRRWRENRTEVTDLLSGVGSDGSAFRDAALLTAGPGAALFADLDGELDDAAGSSTERFRTHMADATSPVLTALGVAAGGVLLVGSGLVVSGMARRLRAYRYQR
ncbi:hypothetical protein [Parafrankia elaeagni]|uniref:hypothetical protein n=1 Tax=Parafrankia elaeagni TaxID=222534 RepID=UPI0003753587|nr:hypothetical protein [Parafrankia elaeagni]